METRSTSNQTGPARGPSIGVSVGLFVVAVATMAYLRLYIFPHDFLTLTYGLPLLLCLWHRDRRLLWAMAAAFVAMTSYKALFLLPNHPAGRIDERMQWVMQVVNIVVIGWTIHVILNLTDKLVQRNRSLAEANLELKNRGEMIDRQNSELQAQAEELARQNEELQQQSEELTGQNEELAQQSEELTAQSEELQAANAELDQRESLLRAILNSLRDAGNETALLENICRTLLKLLGEAASGAAVLETENEQFVVRASAGQLDLAGRRLPVNGSFSNLVLGQNRTAYIDDLAARKDLTVAANNGFRSVLATPLRIKEARIGAIEVYSDRPQHWTESQFRSLEWIAAQCALVLEIGRLQAELRRTMQHLDETNARLETQVRERTAKLTESVEELEHFSYTITHDMRAPLRAILGLAGMLKELSQGSLNAASEECLRKIVVAARRMDILITDALSYSQAVRQHLALTPVNTRELLEGIVHSYPTFQPPRARIVLDPALPPVMANEAALTQCFSNLLGNAVKFVPPDTVPEVKVRAERAGDKVKIWFEDNGIGVPGSFRSKLFDMFQRASKQYEGTGIGLALVRKVVQRMGGMVGQEPAPDGGSRFWLELQAVPGWSDRSGKPAREVPAGK